jgi:transposase
MAKRYSPAYKSKLVERLKGPNAISAHMLSKETGVSQNALSIWLRKARKLEPYMDPTPDSAPQKPWTLKDKLRILFEAEEIPDQELGGFLRREGVHPDQLEAWRGALEESRPDRAAKRRIKELERELRRKEKALAEAAALLILKKKAQRLGLIPEDEDDDTDGASESSL